MSLTILQAAEHFEQIVDTHRKGGFNEYTKGAQNAYQHCATFLRENCQLKWTTDLPIQAGRYYWRSPNLGQTEASLVGVWHDKERGWCIDIGDAHRNPVANFGGEWFGPLPDPTEPDGTPSPLQPLFEDPYGRRLSR